MKQKYIGSYEVKEVIGEGSFGKVYKGIDIVTNQEMALKFISRKGKSKKEIDKQKEEIEILKRLKHEHIIYLKEFIETPEELIVITEFAGKDLSAVLEKQKKLSLNQIRDFATQILSALLYLHQNRIVHRDLKPQNILIKDGKAKLCDFGFARKMSAATLCLHSLKGTPLYIAPQIVSDKAYNHKIDIWSLGIILYQLFCGKPPFYADSYYKLLPKILHDKVKYPKEMDIRLKQLIDGMLQKNPQSRYDYPQIKSHPFLQQNPSVLKQNISVLNHNPNQLVRIDEEEEFNKSYITERNPSKLRPNNNKLNAQELKGIEEDIKLGKPSAKTLKTDLVFYHRLVSLFTLYTLDAQITKQCLYSAVRVIISLIIKVKLDTHEEKEADITKKSELLMSIIKLMEETTEEEGLVTQCYNAICYLLKSNFNLNELNLDAAEGIIAISSQMLRKSKVGPNLFINLLYVIGTLSAQALAVASPEDFYKLILENKLLTLISSKITVQTSKVAFECLKRFVHPTKGDFKPLNLSSLLRDLKSQTASGFNTSMISTLPKLSEGFSPSQSISFNSVIYECIKVSPQFRRKFIELKVFPSVKSDMYSMAICYNTMKHNQCCLLEIEKIKANIIHSSELVSPISSAFEINIFSKYVKIYDQKQGTDYFKVIWKKLGRLLELPDYHKTKQIDCLEGWAFGQPSLKFNDVLVEAFMSLYEGMPQSILSCNVNKFIEDVLKGPELSISSGVMSKLFKSLASICRSTSIEKKVSSLIVDTLANVLRQSHFKPMRESSSDEFIRQYFGGALQLLRQLETVNEPKISEFYRKYESISFQETLISLLDQNQLILIVLQVISKLLGQSGNPRLLEDIASYALPKIKKFYSSPNTNLLMEVIQIVSIVARTDPSFYPHVAATSICEYLPRYLSHSNQYIRQKTINLIGNLAKHSKHFFPDFSKYKVITAVASCLQRSTNYERTIKNIVYAIGNISFYSDKFHPEISPLIPSFAGCLELDNDHLIENTISTLSNLVRHSDIYIQEIIKSGLMKRVIEFIEKKNPKIMHLSVNFVLKAVQHKQIVNSYGEVIGNTVRKIASSDPEVMKKVGKIKEKTC